MPITAAQLKTCTAKLTKFYSRHGTKARVRRKANTPLKNLPPQNALRLEVFPIAAARIPREAAARPLTQILFAVYDRLQSIHPQKSHR